MDKVFDFLREQRGGHFDPALVDHFLANLDKVEAIRMIYTDSELAA
jgi:putative two-component system response regulator